MSRLPQGEDEEDALAAYEAALQVQPDYLLAVQGLALLTVKAGRDDERMEMWLKEIAMRGDPAWSGWARGRLARD